MKRWRQTEWVRVRPRRSYVYKAPTAETSSLGETLSADGDRGQGYEQD